MIKTCVLIPSYNEAKTIGAIIRKIKEKGLAVCVIDDGSTDNTASIGEAEGAAVLRYDKNRGKGAALREGFSYALQKDFDAVLIVDGDGQHDTGDIDSFLKKAEETGADVIIGNRMFDTSSMPLSRHITNRIMSFVISAIAGSDIPDTQCGFKFIRRRVLENIKLESSNYDIESEIILKSARAGFRIESVPIKTVYRDEMSKIRPVIDAARFFLLLIRTALR